MFNSKIERKLTKKIKAMNVDKLRQDISKRKFEQALVSTPQLLKSLNSTFIGITQKEKFRSFHHMVRLLEHAGYRAFVSDEKEKVEQDGFAWLTLLPSAYENIIDINSFDVVGANTNSLEKGAIYLDFESEYALTDFTARLNAAIDDWHLGLAGVALAQEPVHIVGTCPAISYSAALTQWYLDPSYVDLYGGAPCAGIRVTNECYPLVEIFFHDTDIDPNIPDCFVRLYPSGAAEWTELHKPKEDYMAYIDLLRNEYPAYVNYDTTKKSIVDIVATITDVGWAHH